MQVFHSELKPAYRMANDNQINWKIEPKIGDTKEEDCTPLETP